MQITNLVDKYITSFKKGLSRSEYIAEFPALFKHYFTYWGDRRAGFFDDAQQIKNREELILTNLVDIERRFQKSGISLDNVKLVLFVGQNFTNGHSARLDNEWWVWIPVEAYLSELQTRAFVPHEIFHALHYTNQPDLYFNSLEDKQRMSRQVVTEGLATFAVMQIMQFDKKEALWADIMSGGEYEDWLGKYRKRESELIEFVLKSWDKSAGDLFYANDPDDVARYRAGYLLSLEAFGRAFKNIAAQNLLNMPVEEIMRELLLSIKRQERDMTMPRS